MYGAVGTFHAVPQMDVDKRPAPTAFGDRSPTSVVPRAIEILTLTSSVPASASASTTTSRSVDAPANAQGNTPTGAAFSNAQASLFTILAAMGVVAMAL